MHTEGAANGRGIKLSRTLWCGCSLLAMTLGASAAEAQNAAPTTEAQAEAKQNGADVRPDQDTPAAEIVVTGQRAAIDTAIQNKRRSDQIIDSIAADDIGKLPDRSVTEALQRVAGVTIDHFIARNDPDHFSVEGSGVNIRGLTFVRSELNGRDSFTANGGRSLSFEDVPPELLAGVDVYKNPSAELIEGGIGGLVNLRTRMPFDAKGFVASFSVQGTEGDLRKKKEPSFSGLIGDRFDTGIGEIGFLIDIAYSKNATRTDGIQTEPYYPRTSKEVVLEGVNPDGTPNNVTNPLGLDTGQVVYVPKGFDWRTLDFTRKRFGAYGAFQWKPAQNFEFYTTFFQSRYRMDWAENAIFSQTNAYNVVPAAGTSFQYDDDGAFVKGTETDLNPTDGGMPFNDDVRAANRRSVTTDISGGIKWEVTPRLAVRLDLQHVKASTNSFDSTVATGVNLPSQDVDLTGHKPSIHVDESYLADPDNYYWAFTMDHLEHDTGKEWAYRADVDYRFDDSFLKAIRVGFRGTDRKADNKSSPYNWQAVSQTWQLGWYIPRLAMLSEFPLASETHDFNNFYHGKSDVPTKVVFPAVSQATGYPDSYFALHDLTTQLCQELNPTCDPGFALAAYGDAQTNNQTEKTYAGYAMVRFGLDDISNIPLTGNIGVRVVHTKATGAGFVVTPQALTIPEGKNPGDYPVFNGASVAISGGRTYTDVLPSLNLLYKFTPQLQARFAASKAVTRPDFSLLQAYTQLSAGIDQTTGLLNLSASTLTNPNLKPTRADQLDGALEWYFGTASSLTGTLFYKKLHDIVRDTLHPETYFGLTYNVTEPNNVGSGSVKGFEINYNQAFTFLPDLLSGFGINSNFTYVSSTSKVNSNLGAGTTAYLNVNGIDTNGQPFGHLPIEGLSKYSYNIAGYYEKGIVSARLAYNWRSKYLLAVNVNGTQGSDGLYLNEGTSINCGAVGDHCEVWGLPTYNDSYGQLDGSIFFKLWKDRLSLGLEAQNLANAENRVLMQQSTIGTRTRAWFVSDRRYTLSARVSF